jgi:RNA polymerase sigma-70 factor (ECF subfamily)
MAPAKAWRSDEELVERLRAGEERGVEELVSRYAGLAYRLALRVTGNSADAEEITWEVMLTVARKASGFRGDSALSSWIYRIATNAAYEKLRTRPLPAVSLENAGHRLAEAESWVGEPRDWSAWCEDPAVQAELRTVLEKAIAELPLEYRIVIVLHDVEGLPNVEVANLLGHSLPAVKSRVHRARLALRGRLAQYFDQRGGG